MKIMLIISAIIMALLLIMFSVGLYYLGPMVKIGIEKFGPPITKVSVKVDNVDVSVLGSASINNLVIGNPQGFTSPQAIKVGEVSIRLDPLSLTKPKILIHSIIVNSPEIDYEPKFSGSNLSKILSNINLPANHNQPAPKIEIDDFIITQAKVTVSVSNLVSKTIVLPDIHLTDLGKNSDGLTPVELTRAILSALVTSIVQAVSSSSGNISKTFDQLSSSIGGLFSNK